MVTDDSQGNKWPDFLLSCKQVHGEATLLYYGHTLFEVPDMVSLRYWMGILRADRVLEAHMPKQIHLRLRFDNRQAKRLGPLGTGESTKVLLEEMMQKLEKDGTLKDASVIRVKTVRTQGMQDAWSPVQDVRDRDEL